MASSLIIPNTFTASTTAKSAEVNSNFTTIQTWADAIPDGDLTSPNNSTYKTILSGGAIVEADLFAADTYIPTESSTFARSATATDAGPPAAVYFDDADYVVAGLTQKLRVRMLIFTNATAPAISFTGGFYPITVAGGADDLNYTVGTVIAGSTVLLTTPSASSVTQGNSGDFTIPADGAHCLAVAVSGAGAASAKVAIRLDLQTRNT